MHKFFKVFGRTTLLSTYVEDYKTGVGAFHILPSVDIFWDANRPFCIGWQWLNFGGALMFYTKDNDATK